MYMVDVSIQNVFYLYKRSPAYNQCRLDLLGFKREIVEVYSQRYVHRLRVVPAAATEFQLRFALIAKTTCHFTLTSRNSVMSARRRRTFSAWLRRPPGSRGARINTAYTDADDNFCKLII